MAIPSSTSVDSVQFFNCSAVHGGGLAVIGGTAVINRVHAERCVAQQGGGVYALVADVSNSVFNSCAVATSGKSSFGGLGDTTANLHAFTDEGESAADCSVVFIRRSLIMDVARVNLGGGSSGSLFVMTLVCRVASTLYCNWGLGPED